jgi:hypothetical protein
VTIQNAWLARAARSGDVRCNHETLNSKTSASLSENSRYDPGAFRRTADPQR